MVYRSLLSLALAAVMSAPAAAQAPRPQAATGTKWGLVVGVNDYGPNIRGLKYAVSDAAKLYKTLTDPGVDGVPQDHFRLLTTDATTPESRPTRANIVKNLRELIQKAQPNDQFWFYFAGHGKDFDGASYLLPCDFDIANIEGTGLRIKHVRDLLDKECKARQKLVVVDACHSGSTRAIEKEAKLDDEVNGVAGLFTCAAAAVNQCAYESPDFGDGNGAGGVFTYVLVQGLRGAAKKADTPVIRASDIKSYLSENVPKIVQRIALAQQTPQFLPRDFPRVDTGDIPLTRPTTATAPPAQVATREIQLSPKEPLGPAVIIALREKRTLVNGEVLTSDIAETQIKRAFLDLNLPIIDKEGARKFAEILDAKEAGNQAAQHGARFLIVGEAETASNKLEVAGGLITVTANITAKLIDEAGNILAATSVESDPKLAGTELKAANEALQEAAGKLIEIMQPKVAKVLGKQPAKS